MWSHTAEIVLIIKILETCQLLQSTVLPSNGDIENVRRPLDESTLTLEIEANSKRENDCFKQFRIDS
jgi:hypothetical protein